MQAYFIGRATIGERRCALHKEHAMSWLHWPHEGGLTERSTNAVLMALVIASFVALALGAAIYDIGDWVGAW
jgi:hypothetical protein